MKKKKQRWINKTLESQKRNTALRCFSILASLSRSPLPNSLAWPKRGWEPWVRDLQLGGQNSWRLRKCAYWSGHAVPCDKCLTADIQSCPKRSTHCWAIMFSAVQQNPLQSTLLLDSQRNNLFFLIGTAFLSPCCLSQYTALLSYTVLRAYNLMGKHTW